MAKKGPQYFSCNERQSTCTRRQAQPRLGCPTCEFTIQYKIYKDELEKELKGLKNSTRRGARKWPTKMLLDMVVEIGSIASSTKRVIPSWSVVVARLVSAYRDESAKIRASDNFAITANLPKGNKKPVPDDDGDFD